MSTRWLASALGLAALAAAGACAPGGTLPGVLPEARTGQPLEWFAENWGPFDSEMRGIREDGRPGPLVFVDGRQVPPEDQQGRSLYGLSPDEIRRIVTIKFRNGAGLFGESGNRGVVMVFSERYRGALPASRKAQGEPPPCVPLPEFAPIDYFSQLGPFDGDLNIRRYFDQGPLILLDGRQVEVDRGASIEDLQRLFVIERDGGLFGSPDPDLRSLAVADLSRGEDFRGIHPVTCDVSHQGYGPAATGGLLLLFTDEWKGPLLESEWTRKDTCRSADR